MSTPSRFDIWKMFNQISSTYDRVNRILSLGMDQKWRKAVCAHLPNKKRLKILDLATGTADQLIALLENVPTIEMAIGIDLAKEMLTIGKEKINAKSYKKRIELIEADAQNLPFSDASFDAATFSFGIRNVLDPLLSLKEIHRVLQPEGRVLILEFALPPRPLRWAHLFYLRHVLPRVGALFSKNKEAYHYLNQTIETFPQGKAFCSLMEEVGFVQVRIKKMGFGAVALYIGTKQ